MRVYERVRISTLPPLFFIKALIFQGFFVFRRFWSPIWSPTFSLAASGFLRMVMDGLRSWCGWFKQARGISIGVQYWNIVHA